MDEQKTALIIHALDKGRAMGGTEATRADIEEALRSLQIILFDCFKSEYKPGVIIFLEFLKSSNSSSKQLAEAVAMLSEYRLSEIMYSTQKLLSL